jgi:hypothetical protein
VGIGVRFDETATVLQFFLFSYADSPFTAKLTVDLCWVAHRIRFGLLAGRHLGRLYVLSLDFMSIFLYELGRSREIVGVWQRFPKGESQESQTREEAEIENDDPW